MTDDFVQVPLFDDHVDYDNYDDHDHYGYQDDNNIFNRDLGSSASRSSTPISVPHSQNHERMHAHQQKVADDKYLTKTYHPKLSGESFGMFETSLYLLEFFMCRSDMRSIWKRHSCRLPSSSS